MTTVYSPKFYNVKTNEAKTELIVFEKRKDCEQWILSQGYLAKLDNGKYIGEDSFNLINYQEEDLIEQQRENGINSIKIDWDFAINESLYKVNHYEIIELEYIQEQIYDTDIEREKQAQQRQEKFDNMVNESINQINKAQETWNKSETKKNVGKFLSGLGNKAQSAINQVMNDNNQVEVENPKNNPNYLTTNELLIDLNTYFNPERTDNEILVKKGEQLIATVNIKQMFNIKMESALSTIPEREQENLYNMLNKYAATPISYREQMDVILYTVYSPYLTKEENNKQFESKYLAEEYINKVFETFEIKEEKKRY